MAKTLKVATLIEMANAYFANSPDDARMERLAVQNFVGQLLHDTKNYAGFNYLTPYGEPGCDSSRVFFYKNHKL